ncbi:MAG: hypothetical protein HOL85_00640 [Rhodospirillaceae bacterium]|nr:hypothetical protein [Rhodospirillaceae bacterium]MBT6137144.1 hypothetical protein [Rhodospirillaceae bacterium]
MVIARRLFMEAARRLAGDPRVQRKAAELAEKAYSHAQPTLSNASTHVSESMRETLAEVDPLEEPGRFLKNLKSRMLPPEDDE